ncbi:YwiC-like family protein [Actinomyces bowdenii]|nr:YwiC-like family protein [Actinomyces bowdenii]
MSQSRPSGPSQRRVERLSDQHGVPEQAAVSASAPSEPAGPRSAPSHQSRPGPSDDVMLSTGRPRPAPPPTQEQIRRQPGRKAWVPNQHGAWSMLVLPPIVGWVVGGWSWVNLLLLPAWWGAYLTYWAWSQWLRTRSPRRRALILLPLLVYTGWTALLALITLIAAPYLVQWAVPLAPLFAIAVHQVWRGHERSLISGLVTTAAASLMAAVTYSLAVRGAGGFLGLGAGASELPGGSPNGALTGWPWMWLVTGLTAAYFCGTVPYIKSMIRERFNYPLLAGEVAAHAAMAGVTIWLASGGYLPVAHAALWVVLALRSLVMPLWQWRLVRTRHRPLRPGVLGIVEVVMCVAFLLTLSTP